MMRVFVTGRPPAKCGIPVCTRGLVKETFGERKF